MISSHDIYRDNEKRDGFAFDGFAMAGATFARVRLPDIWPAISVAAYTPELEEPVE
jgi:hypothetical protein